MIGSRTSRPFLQSLTGNAYITPAMALLFFVLILPSLYGFYYSLHFIKYLRATDFIGLENYAYVLTDPLFPRLVLRTFVFTVIAVVGTVSLALAISLWIDTLRGGFALFVQIVVLMPWVLSHVVGALLFRWVFVNDIGIGMYLLQQITGKSHDPIGDPTMSMAVLILYACWRTLGFAMLFLLAGIKSIPTELYEAAEVDGASAWQKFVTITLPMLRTPMMITLVMLTISNINNIEGPLIVTGGAPAGATNVIALDLYMRAFSRYDYNTAIALGVGMFAANILLAFAYVRLVRRPHA